MAQKGNQKRERDKYFFVALFFIISLILIAGAFYVQSRLVVERMEIPIYLEINNVTGIQVTNESLDFGKITYESAARKKIDLSNNYGFPVKVYFNCEGDVCEFMNFEKIITLETNEKKEASFSTITFSNEPYGKYSGEIKVVFKKVIR